MKTRGNRGGRTYISVGAAALAVAWVLCGELVVAQAAADDSAGWSLMDDDGFAKIESRPLADSKVREIRITSTLKWPAKRLMALIGDVQHYPSFMPPTETAQALGGERNSGRYYIIIDPPIIHRRDYCVQISISELPDGRLQSRFRSAEATQGCPAEQPNLVRMSRVEGSWTLTPLADGSTRVVYQAVTDPAGAVPTWMVNRAAGGSVRDMFHALDRAASDGRIASCSLAGSALASIGCGL